METGIKEKIHALLKEINKDLTLLNDPFYVIGASALILSGVEVENTFDIDLLTSARDADLLKTIWKDRQLNTYIPADGHQFRSNFGRFGFGDMDVEVMGNLEVCRNDKWVPLRVEEPVKISGDGFEVHVPSLADQKRILHFFGRPKDHQKIRLIEKYLEM
ncbi:hypothetical protein GVN16_24325 [Emticicia sp. CRIBPO]|uniref:hypothetical protein n=1 Tax=Emticicia sp. CRIBPO TaxID=2683258 RepID=UPI001412EAF8|nr:hypothetical protein [Emticicia sp. CRIBPO]NBA88924.1 hypothetical protein [Emticicia sp. CRIBPO]